MPDEPTMFKYERPDELTHAKEIEHLIRTDLTRAQVQLVQEGGANNLHSHTGNEGFWLVLGGEARFYTEDDEVVGTFGKHKGVLIPRDYPYWFESAGEKSLEILHIASVSDSVEDRRVDHEAHWREQER